MRRPAPLPASAEDPDEVDAPARRPGRLRRRAATDVRTDVDEPSVVESAANVTEEIETDAGVAAMQDADAVQAGFEPADPDGIVRSGDVWRAARARRKALRAEIRRFTQRSRRRRIIWWSSIGAIVALVLGSVIAAYSPLFAVEKVTVVGAERVDAAAVQQALSGQLGSPLALIDAGAVKSALTEFPMIETYAIEARPPHELLVRIVERTPVGVIRSAAGYTLVDAAGVVLATTPQKPEGQPALSISGGTDSAAFHSVGLVIRSLPADLRAQVVQVKASSADDVTLVLQDGKNVVWGSEEDSVTKAIVLVALIKNAPESHTFDVSAPTAPVVR
ncbi:FtsQ-type POTRA domain-containing protein [Microbacterium suwonense]|uniref:FtsQ-type POTRA domain-containing protein n=1 Tax=Microbacterium suwonense TaxID=683047 RepID=UPI0036095708